MSILEIKEVTENYGKKILYTNPHIYTMTHFLTKDECDHFINLGKGNMSRALVSGTAKGYESKGRSGSNYWIKHDVDEITSSVAEKISILVGVPVENAEAFQLIHYDATQEYRQHYDGWVLNENDIDGYKKAKRNMKWGGQRIWTALVYLNDVLKGGGTKFTKLDITCKAKKGKILVFANAHEGSNVRHELSEHAGLPVEEGEKWAFNLWFREKSRKELFFPIYEKKREIINNTSYFDDTIIKTLIDNCHFNNRRRRDGWVGLSVAPSLIKKIEQTTGIDSSFYENINIVEYKENVMHPKHFTAYDLHSENGKKYTQKLGQRQFTISLLLTDHIEIDFPTLQEKYHCKRGDCLIYKNTLGQKRDANMERSIVCKNGTGYLANIYIRAKNRKGEILSNLQKEELPDIGEKKIVQLENYMEIDYLENKWTKLVNKIVLLKNNKHYRFGDIVFHKGWPPKYDEWKNSQENVLNNKDFNNTILKEYIKKNNHNIVVPSKEKIRLIFSEIIKNKILEKQYLVPKDDELVIHLRTGDAVVHSWFLKKPYLKLIQDSVDKYNIKRVTFVTSFHYGNNKLTNGKTIIFQYNHNKQKKNIDKLTDLFKNIVLKFPFLKFDVLSSKDIDQDFVYMCTANHFISDKGGFSELITIVQNEVKIRRRKRILFKS